MSITAQISRQLQEVHYGENWTWSNLKDHLEDVDWKQATTKVYDFNTIAALVYHINYYISAVITVLEGGPLTAKDEFSFDHPPINSQKDWDALLDRSWAEAKKFADLIEKLPEEKLWEDLDDPKYGSYYRNLHGIIEHAHYHLGQIVLIKKIIKNSPV